MFALTKEELIEKLKLFPNTAKVYIGCHGHNGSIDWEEVCPIINVTMGVMDGKIILEEDEITKE